MVSLTLLDRLIVAAHRAGCAPLIVVSTGDLPDHRRSQALGIPVEHARLAPRIAGPALVASTRQWVVAADLAQLRRFGGRLISTGGSLLPSGVVRELLPPTPSGAARGPLNRDVDGTESVELEHLLSSLPRTSSVGGSVPVTDGASARIASAALWGSLSSASDGLVDRWFNRPAGRLLMSRWLTRTPITPNQISVFATVLGVSAGALLSSASSSRRLAGAILFQFSAIVDCVDGDIARSMFKESALGKWLDLAGDQVVHAAVFIGIAVGLSRIGTGPFLWLGASAVLGGLIAFAVVLRGMKSDKAGNHRLQRLIDAATNRDFSVLVLALECVGRLEWFLWMAAIGSHAFWVTALWLQGADKRDRSSASCKL